MLNSSVRRGPMWPITGRRAAMWAGRHAGSGEMPGSKMDGHNFAETKQKQAAEANRKAGNSHIAELHDKAADGHHAASIAAWNDIHGKPAFAATEAAGAANAAVRKHGSFPLAGTVQR